MQLLRASICVSILTSLAFSQQVLWKDNPISGKVVGLTYGVLSWPEAEAQAVSYGGHLATIESAADEAWAISQFSAHWPSTPSTPVAGFGPWIGLNDIAAEGQWLWSSGSVSSYRNWSSSTGEPNDANGGEDFVQFGVLSVDWRWNDNSGQHRTRGMIEVPQRPARSWSWPVHHGVGGPPARGWCGDLTYDGFNDFVCPSPTGGVLTVWINDTHGQLVRRTPDLFVGNGIESVQAKDANVDGYIDLLMARGGAQGEVLLLPGTALGPQFGAAVQIAAVPYALNAKFASHGDLCDRVVVSCGDAQGSGFLQHYEQVSANSWVLRQSVATGLGIARELHLASFGASEPWDAVLGRCMTAPAGIAVVQFLPGVGYQPGPLVLGAGTAESVTLGDIDRDRKMDIVELGAGSAAIRVWKQLGGYLFLDAGTHSAGGQTAVCAEVVDLDGDGDEDLLVGTAASTVVTLLQGATGFVVDHSFEGQSAVGMVAVHDYSGDLRPDALAVNFSNIGGGNGFTLSVNQSRFDCDGNGVDDAIDIATGAMADCDGNKLADVCERKTDANDCDASGVLDACELQVPANDCDTNGILDSCDLAYGAGDCDGNGRIDQCDVAAGAPDCNLTGIPDPCEIANGFPDVDADGVPDECLNDCNGNGLKDHAEVGTGLAPDCNSNVLPDSCDIASGVDPDCDGSGLPDSCDIAAGASDCDADGQLDACELAGGAADCDGNGRLDNCDIAAGGDCDHDGTLDACQQLTNLNDCDHDGVLDACQPGGLLDCDGNGQSDACDPDINADGVPDACQAGGTPYCFGTAGCPCGAGAAGNGCPNSQNPAGARLAASGLPSRIADSLRLEGTGMPQVSPVLYFQGAGQSNGIPFGDGLLCAIGAAARLGYVTNTGGASHWPPAGGTPIHVGGSIPATGAVTRYYQAWYRDANPTFCTTNRFNHTNGVAVVWLQ